MEKLHEIEPIVAAVAVENASASSSKRAASRCEKLAARIARVVRRRTSGSIVGLTVEVRRDGVVVGPSEWNTGVPVDPGQHVISAAAPGRIRLGPPGHALGDTVEPTGHRLTLSDRYGPPRQDQERGLERILGVVRVAQDLAADAQDHRPVPLDQRREPGLGRLITTAHEPLQELTIRQVPDHPDAIEGVQVSQAAAIH